MCSSLHLRALRVSVVNHPSTPDSNPRRITDSPWFWVYILSTGAMVALFVMDAKYTRSQDHEENVYLYGTRTLAKPADGGPSAKPFQAPKTDGANSQAAAPERAPLTVGPQPQTHSLLISLVPLRVITFVIMVVSCVMLQIGIIRARRASQVSSPTPQT
jgi:hypothetical protein